METKGQGIGTKIGNAIGGAVSGAAGAVVGQGMGMLFGKYNDKRQLEQQGKLQQQQIEGNERMGKFQQGLQMDLWNKTNYGAQMAHMKDAGLNPALMYGMGGGGGASTGAGTGNPVGGGNADGAGVAAQNGMGLALMGAQKNLIDAQARKANIDADKAAGVDTEKGKQEISASKSSQKLVDFEASVNELINASQRSDRWQAEKGLVTNELKMSDAKIEAELTAMFGKNADGSTKSASDVNTPFGKKLAAEMEQAAAELKKTRATTNAQEAEATIKAFGARLAERGISPDSPWYLKIISDVAERAGINLSRGK